MESLLYLCMAISMIGSAEKSEFELTAKGIATACKYTPLLIEEAKKQDIDPYIMAAIIWNESRWTPDVTDGTSCGLGQITPTYVRKTCKQLMVPETNLATMASVLRHWRNWENGGPFGNPDLHMIACYAAGTVCANSRKAVKHGRFILRLAGLYRETAESIMEKEKQGGSAPEEKPEEKPLEKQAPTDATILEIKTELQPSEGYFDIPLFVYLVADRPRRYYLKTVPESDYRPPKEN